MGMSTHIQGFIPDTDKEYQRHRDVYLVCENSKVSLPEETALYFGTKFPDHNVLDDKLEIELKLGQHYTEWGMHTSSGFEIDLNKLPKGVSKIRFYNNW